MKLFFEKSVDVSEKIPIFGVRKTKIMSNKRNLKRSINVICDELFAECVAASLYGGANEKADVESLLVSVAAMRDDYISRLSHPEPGIPQKEYFRKLISSFTEHVNEMADHINNAF